MDILFPGKIVVPNVDFLLMIVLNITALNIYFFLF